MKTEIKTAIICGMIITIGIISISIFYNEVDMKRNTIYNIEIEDKSKLQKVPSVLDATGYINIPSNELAETLEGKVVLYDIWTYSCINCIRTLPYITTWDEKYRSEGLVIVGIHTPEFEFEKDKDSVLTAVQKFDINYPVVLDNEKEIWNAFQNKYWPRKYISDHDGYIRYDHIGEGSYKETEKVIQQLLQERSESLNIKTNTFELANLGVIATDKPVISVQDELVALYPVFNVVDCTCNICPAGKVTLLANAGSPTPDCVITFFPLSVKSPILSYYI